MQAKRGDRRRATLREDWLSGAPVSNAVCWLKSDPGENGAIARTSDGDLWERIPPPAFAADSAGKLPDWIGVTASDGQTATVTANDRRRYTTQDGGKTWRAQ